MAATARRWLLIPTAFGFLLLVLGAFAVGQGLHRGVSEELSTGLASGMTREEVRGLLGEPTSVHGADAPPGSWTVPGFALPRARPVAGEVHVHRGGLWVHYVWFDREGRVEDWDSVLPD